MSDDKDYIPKINNQFNKDYLLEYFTKHTNKHQCPECAHPDFDIVSLSSTSDGKIAVDGVTIKSLPDSFGFVPRYKMYIQFICRNCGYVKLYDLNIINKRINKLQSENLK